MDISRLPEPVGVFVQRVKALGIVLSDQQIIKLAEFCRLIGQYGEHTNIVGNADLSVLLNDHVLDSLALLPVVKKYSIDVEQPALLDVGSGAGFPAIVLALAMPTLKITLVEANGKKCRFLAAAVGDLAIGSRTTICHARAEELAHDSLHRAAYDLATARAVADLDLTAEIAAPFLRRGGIFIAQKSAAQLPEQERRASICLPKLGCELKSVEHLDSSVLGKERVLIVALKTGETDPLYPRVWNKIKEKPLA